MKGMSCAKGVEVGARRGLRAPGGDAAGSGCPYFPIP